MQYNNLTEVMMYNQSTVGIGYVGGGISVNGNAFPTVGVAPLDELSKSLEGAASRTFEAANRVRAIADSLFGAIPEAAEKSGVSPNRSGRIGSLNDQSDVIHAALSQLQNQLDRLSSL